MVSTFFLNYFPRLSVSHCRLYFVQIVKYYVMKSKQLKGVEFYQLQLSFRYFHYSFIRLKLNKCNWHVHLSLVICNVASKF